MNKILAITVACMFSFSTVAIIHAAEEKTDVKVKKDGSWKMKIKRKGDKDFVGEYNGHTYNIRGGDFGANFHEGGEYTVYGEMAPDDTYITTSRVEPFETRETVVTTAPVVVDDGSWTMHVTRRGDHDWIGVVGDKTYTLRGDHIREPGEYTVHGHLSNEGFITTSRVERLHDR